MDWTVVTGIGVIIAGIFIAGTALGTRGKILPIIFGIALVLFGAYLAIYGEKAFLDLLKLI